MDAMPRVQDLVEEISQLPSDWHGAGSVSGNVLRAIASHAERMGAIQHSVETGSGRTTLLFSHLSADHVVFSVDAGQSINQVRNSHLFNARSTTFVEGPTQRTLPGQIFTHGHQLVLIDGPHGYPFPDLEYYYLYPTIDAGGLLLLDDIQIPSIGRMFDIIRAEEMFELLEIVDDNTAFLRRTGAPPINPESDSWWLQGYNRPYYQQLVSPPQPQPAGRPFGSFVRGVTRRLRSLIPAGK
jgi:Methyltransferase domain